MKMLNKDAWYTPKEAADFLECNIDTIYALCERGVLVYKLKTENPDGKPVKRKHRLVCSNSLISYKGQKKREGKKATAEPATIAQTEMELPPQNDETIRINMAITKDNHTFMKVLAAMLDDSVEGVYNRVVAKYRSEYFDLMDKLNTLKNF